jgi:hypothetical protein
MTSQTTDGFWKCYRTLPEQIKKEAKKAYEGFKKTLIIPAFISSEFIQPDQSSLFAPQKTIAL